MDFKVAGTADGVGKLPAAADIDGQGGAADVDGAAGWQGRGLGELQNAVADGNGPGEGGIGAREGEGAGAELIQAARTADGG